MNITFLDRSNYFRGLLLIIKHNRTINDYEIQLMKIIGTALGFEKLFCSEAIKNILINEYVRDEPPAFSHPGIAKMFIKDSLKLAYSDNNISNIEREYLYSIAITNNISTAWINQQLINSTNLKAKELQLEIEKINIV